MSFLKFKLKTTKQVDFGTFVVPMNKLNGTKWFGKEPGSCKVHPSTKGKTIGNESEFDIIVECRKPGEITWKNGGWMEDGWQAKHIDIDDRTKTLLDGSGNPLPEHGDPVFLKWDIYYDFGVFVEEVDSLDEESC